MTDSDRETQFAWRLILVPLLCLGGAFGGGYVLYQDLHDSGEASGGKTLGKVERREAQVRRKSAHSYIWNNIDAGENLFIKDSVQTGRGSAVSLRLVDGSILDIGENSLVVMDDSAELSLGYLRGSIVVHKAEGDSKISVGKDGKTHVEDLVVRLLKPESLARYFVPEKTLKSMTFGWDLRVPGTHSEGFTFQVSDDPRFYSQSTVSIQLNESEKERGATHLTQSVSTQLGPGLYYWRLIQKNKILSEVRRFQIFSALALQSIWPANHAKVKVLASDRTFSPRWVASKVSTQGEGRPQLEEHILEIARDTNFKDLVVSELINPTTGSTAVHGLSNGSLYWKIKSVYRDRGGEIKAYSAVKQFDLILQTTAEKLAENPPLKKMIEPSVKSPLLPFPDRVNPGPGTTLNLLDRKVSVEASWGKVLGAEKYDVTIYSASSGSGVQGKVAFQRNFPIQKV